MAYERITWIDDDGSLTVGTTFDAANMNRIEAGIKELHIGHDAVSNSAEANTAAAFTWTHTPVTTNPRGILVFVVQDAESGVASDQITTVTYGGVAMSEVASSPFLKTLGANDASLHAFFLGTGIPAGAQTVSVTSTGTQKKRAVAISLQGNKDLRVEAVKTSEEEVTTMAPAAVTAAGQESVVYGFAQAGATAVGEVAPSAGMTELFESAIATTRAMAVLRKTANGSGGSQAVSWTFSAKKAVGAFVVAVGPVRDFGIVTALPTIAGIGDHCHYVADKTNGVIWDLVYDGEGEYPWKKIGGPPLRASDNGGPRTTTSKTAVSTGSPSITAPLAMEFRARFGAKYVQKRSATGSPETGEVQLFVNGVSKDTLIVVAPGQFDAVPGDIGSDTVVAASGNVIQPRYLSENGGEWGFGRLFVEVDPIRVK